MEEKLKIIYRLIQNNQISPEEMSILLGEQYSNTIYTPFNYPSYPKDNTYPNVIYNGGNGTIANTNIDK